MIHTKAVHNGESWGVEFHNGNQYFNLSYEADTKEEAEWMQWQLQKFLKAEKKNIELEARRNKFDNSTFIIGMFTGYIIVELVKLIS